MATNNNRGTDTFFEFRQNVGIPKKKGFLKYIYFKLALKSETILENLISSFITRQNIAKEVKWKLQVNS